MVDVSVDSSTDVELEQKRKETSEAKQKSLKAEKCPEPIQ